VRRIEEPEKRNLFGGKVAPTSPTPPPLDPPAPPSCSGDWVPRRMTPPRGPLAEAQRRLGRPGRPRKVAPAGPPHVAPAGRARPPLGQALPRDPLLQRRSEADGTATGLSQGLSRRLLDLEGTAIYLGISPRSVRALEAAGTLYRVEIPLGSGELRKVLYDRVQLDRLVDGWSRA